MASISSIPTTRVSDLLVRERLLTQLQSEQARLLQLQTQVSTGQRFQRPSEGPVQALQGIAIRNLLQRKEQTKANLASANSYVSTTETALSNVSSLVNDVRAWPFNQLAKARRMLSTGGSVQSRRHARSDAAALESKLSWTVSICRR